jgi:hypothetical protein
MENWQLPTSKKVRFSLAVLSLLGWFAFVGGGSVYRVFAQQISSSPSPDLPQPTAPASDRDLDAVLQSPNARDSLSNLDLESLTSSAELSSPQIDLAALPLLPNPITSNWLTQRFEQQVRILNDRITFRQTVLRDLLADPNSNDASIRQVQAILSQLRTQRDRLAIEHILLMRQIQDNFTLPSFEHSAAASTAP